VPSYSTAAWPGATPYSGWAKWMRSPSRVAVTALVLAEPVPVGNAHRRDRQCLTRADDDPRLLRLDTDDVERLLLPTDLDPAALADGKMDHAAVLAEDAAIEIDDVAGGRGLRP